MRSKIPIYALLLILLASSLSGEITVNLYPDDQYEPDNSFETATLILFQEEQKHTLTAQDKDYYVFSTNDTIMVEISIHGTWGNFLVDVFYENQSKIEYSAEHDEARYRSVVLPFEPGVYFFSVSEAVGYELEYLITLSSSTDFIDTNISAETAEFLPPNTTISRLITYNASVSENDRDWFQVNITSEALYSLQVTSYLADLEIYLLDEFLSQVAFFEMDNFGNKFIFRLQEFLNPNSYFILIEGFSRGSGIYNIFYNSLNEDDYEPNDSPSQASLLPFNVSQTANLINYYTPDIDFWKFTVNESIRYSIVVRSDLRYVDVELQDADQFYLQNFNSYNDQFNNRYYRADFVLEEGDYFIRIESYSSWSGNYTISFEYMIPDQYEPNDTFETATQLELWYYNFYYLRTTFHNLTDEDWFQLTFDTEVTLLLEYYARGLGSTGNLAIEIYDSNQNSVGSFYQDSMILYAQEGTYYIRLSQIGEVLEYTLYPQLIYADQYEDNNDVTSATRLSLGTYQSHTLHTNNDVDWFYFVLSQERSVTIETHGWNGDPVMYLYSESMQQIAFNDDFHGELYPTIREVLQEGTYYVKIQPLDFQRPSAAYEISLHTENPNLNSGNNDPTTSKLEIGFSMHFTLTLMILSFGTIIFVKRNTLSCR